jgi:hypothetical protein
MIVGNQGRFAIEFALDSEAQADVARAAWLFGRIRWWCGGEPVGRYDGDTTLRDFATIARELLVYEGQRIETNMMRAPIHEVFRTLELALYEDHGQSDKRVAEDERNFRRFAVAPTMDVFDDWYVFLIEGGSIARLVWQRVAEAEPHECALDAGEFDGVLKQFLLALQGAASVGPGIGRSVR